MSKLNITCRGFKPYRRNTLYGFAEIHINELRLTVRDVAIHQKGDSRWAQLPAKPQMRDGQPVKGDDGKIQYFPILEFDARPVRDAFSRAVVDALLAFAPAAFDEEFVL